MTREFQIAVNSSINQSGVVYDRTLEEWRNETWETRSEYLPPPFGHDINTSDVSAYYEMIGHYYSQFGFGWIDAYDLTLYQPGAENYRLWEASGDDPATIGYDGNSPFFYHYRDLIQ